MLRAITSYFFGEIQDQMPEAPIECETREVNDWLVVNLPDQKKEEIDLNDEDNTIEEEDDDGTSEIDEDDTSEVDASDVDEDESSEADEDEVDATDRWPVREWGDNYERLQRYMALSNVERHRCFPSEVMAFYCPYLRYVVPRIAATASLRPSRDYGEPETKELIPVQNNPHYELVAALIRSTQGKRAVNEFERKYKVFKSQSTVPCPRVIMTSKDYYNHRHPEKPQHNDLLQQIKELEPEQQAVQRSIRKNITRGQLNRQNKNYMYDTSSKKNRRCNRQRNHSGANNNRKC